MQWHKCIRDEGSFVRRLEKRVCCPERVNPAGGNVGVA
jgi:hypothetical protein